MELFSIAFHEDNTRFDALNFPFLSICHSRRQFKVVVNKICNIQLILLYSLYVSLVLRKRFELFFSDTLLLQVWKSNTKSLSLTFCVIKEILCLKTFLKYRNIDSHTHAVWRSFTCRMCGFLCSLTTYCFLLLWSRKSHRVGEMIVFSFYQPY